MVRSALQRWVCSSTPSATTSQLVLAVFGLSDLWIVQHFRLSYGWRAGEPTVQGLQQNLRNGGSIVWIAPELRHQGQRFCNSRCPSRAGISAKKGGSFQTLIPWIKLKKSSGSVHSPFTLLAPSCVQAPITDQTPRLRVCSSTDQLGLFRDLTT